jgi:transposase
VIGEELERLRQEAETWKDRWLSERRDHEATIEHCDRIMNSAADHGDR